MEINPQPLLLASVDQLGLGKNIAGKLVRATMVDQRDALEKRCWYSRVGTVAD